MELYVYHGHSDYRKAVMLLLTIIMPGIPTHIDVQVARAMITIFVDVVSMVVWNETHYCSCHIGQEPSMPLESSWYMRDWMGGAMSMSLQGSGPLLEHNFKKTSL